MSENQVIVDGGDVKVIVGNGGQAVIVAPIVEEVLYGGGEPGAPGPGASFTTTGTTITVGGIPAGTVYTAAPMQEVLTDLLCPFQHPAFTSFGLTGIASPLEVGASFGPGVTFNWSTSQGGNVTPNSISLGDATLGTVLATGLANSGSHAVTLPAAITRASAGTHAFNIGGTDTESTTFTDSVTFAWQWRRYVGTNASAALTGAQILALASSALATGYAGTYSLAAGGFKFICLADAVGGGLNSVRDQSTGFSVPMATGSNTDGGGFGYELVSVTNAQGATANVRVYRTLNQLGGAVTLLVS